MELMSNHLLKRSDMRKPKHHFQTKNPGIMHSAAGFKGITDIKFQEHELAFHPHFAYEWFTFVHFITIHCKILNLQNFRICI